MRYSANCICKLPGFKSFPWYFSRLFSYVSGNFTFTFEDPIWVFICWAPPFCKGGGRGWILIDSRGEGNLKNWKRWWKYGAEEGLLEDWGGAGTFSTWFFRGLSFLHLEIILLIAKLCYTFEEKLFFPATIIFLPSFQVV